MENEDRFGLDSAWALSSTTPSAGSTFTELDAFDCVIDENEMHEMLNELDDLKIDELVDARAQGKPPTLASGPKEHVAGASL